MRVSTIAIDGPAASGKSTVGELLARQLEFFYFDTGVMYRAVTWAALDRGIPIEDEAAVTALAEVLHIDVAPPTVDDGRQYTVLADDADITWEIRTPEVNAAVSPVSAYAGVRKEMVRQQRRVAQGGRIVMAGRDIGTVVLPGADVKIFLDATVEERARRRWQEELERGKESDLEGVLESMRRRDRIDSSREVSPLVAAEDAIVLDSTRLSIEQVVAEVERLIATKEQRCSVG